MRLGATRGSSAGSAAAHELGRVLDEVKVEAGACLRDRLCVSCVLISSVLKIGVDSFANGEQDSFTLQIPYAACSDCTTKFPHSASMSFGIALDA